jgi:hypothetical protein
MVPYDVRKIPLSDDGKYFTAMFYFPNGKEVICRHILTETRLKEWNVKLTFGSGSASKSGYIALKDRGSLLSDEDVEREKLTFDQIVQELKKKVDLHINKTTPEQNDEAIKTWKKSLANWYERSVFYKV